jgi:hypothetical protein
MPHDTLNELLTKYVAKQVGAFDVDIKERLKEACEQAIKQSIVKTNLHPDTVSSLRSILEQIN